MTYAARTPKSADWSFDGACPAAGPSASRFHRGHVVVVSSLDLASLPDGSGQEGLQWHVSISFNRKRVKDNLVRMVLREFGMVGAEEDNHHPGLARHFWIPVDPTRRVDCECKTTETVIVERDGYPWTNPTPDSGEACRGCEWARSGLGKARPCSVHGLQEAL
jgi:hypothetical protein